MSLIPHAGVGTGNSILKDRLRRQMHHDLCVLSAGGANVTGREHLLKETAQNARALYKLLWSQVMEELP